MRAERYIGLEGPLSSWPMRVTQAGVGMPEEIQVPCHRGRSIGTYVAGAGLIAFVLLAGVLASRKIWLPRPATALLLRQAAAAIDARDHRVAVRLLDEILER